MERIEKTVFVSYRRADDAWGVAIFQDLTQHGYDVFIDYDGIASGNFEAAILDNVKSRAHFLVLLTPTALERCSDPKDWMRREIEAALDYKRNIVPVMLAGFDFDAPSTASQLTGKLAALKKYNGLEIPKGRFFSSEMERLRKTYLNVAVDAVLHPASDLALQAARDQQAAARTAPAVHDRELAQFEAGRPQTYRWWKAGLECARSVASIRQKLGNRIATGFLVRAATLGLQPSEELLVLTNFHAVNEDGISPGIRRDEAEVVFEVADANRAYTASAIVWSSPVTSHDASILRLQDAVTGIDPMRLAGALPIVEDGARVYIIGHAGGRELAFSFQGNELIDHEGPPGGNPQIKGVSRVHYHARTEPGSGGSPVFNDQWEVIALHHMSRMTGMPKLNGKTGSYGASEGISLLSIKQAILTGTG